MLQMLECQWYLAPLGNEASRNSFHIRNLFGVEKKKGQYTKSAHLTFGHMEMLDSILLNASFETEIG